MYRLTGNRGGQTNSRFVIAVLPGGGESGAT